MSRFERWAVWTTSLLTAVTGLAYLGFKYGLEPVEPWAVINHPLQPVVLKAHIVVAPLLLFALGLITTRHIWRHWRSGAAWGRRSGVTTVLATAPMVLSGYLIQVLTAAPLLAAAAWTHIVTGVVFSVGLGLHQVVVRKGNGERGTGNGKT
ncbi:MAG TPA: hypothetical protein VLA95_03270 [Gemmatimonadales bacterium]|nr:hypothetical protein [Gemmatimonadales bacterium]